MRICIVHPYKWPDVRRGGERYVMDLGWYLRSQGHTVDVISKRRFARGAAHPRNKAILGITSVETFGLVALPSLISRRGRYDVVHAMTPSAAIAAHVAGHRTLYTVLGHPSSVPRRMVRRRLLSSAISRADVVAALSPESANALGATFGREAEVLPPGIRTDNFVPSRRESDERPPTILFAAALDRPEKGLSVLVAAFDLLLRRHPNAMLLLSGQGDPSRSLRTSDKSVRERIRPLGPGKPEELPALYSSVDVTVLPARNEAFGLVLVESLACGTPVVATNSGGMSYVLDDPRIGRIAPQGDPVGLADAIDAVLASSRRPEMADICRRHAMRWDWIGAVGPAHERLYRRMSATDMR